LHLAVRSPQPDTTHPPTRLRWIAVVLCILYGFAKLTGAQFTILDSELARPLGQVSGFWLTWHYFGYSPVYGSLIAVVQIGGALLVAWPRTALLGALLLLPVFGNIVLINLFYGIDPGATVVALVILGCLLAVIAPYAARLKEAMMLPAVERHSRLRIAAIAVILLAAWAFTWWSANYNNRRPTPIDGIWTVVQPPAEGPGRAWRRVFFERNRAHWVTFRADDGTDARHHFEVDADGMVRIWETWLSKGELILQGRHTGDRIELDDLRHEGASLVLGRTDTY